MKKSVDFFIKLCYNKYRKQEINKKEITPMRTLVFDMDGTIADLYGQVNWLADLEAENPAPYINAEPLYEMAMLNEVLHLLKGQGWRIAVTSWLAKDSTKEYDVKVRQAKREWLEKYEFPFDEIHLVKYGTTKANCTRKHGGYQILIDDNATVRKGWTLGATIDATENILTILKKLLDF